MLSVNGKVGNVLLEASDIPVTADVDFANNQLKNIKAASDTNDSVRFDQLMQHHFYFGYCNENIVPLTGMHTLQFDRDIAPTGLSVVNAIQYNAGVFNMSAGIYKTVLKVGVRYKESTETPGFVSLVQNG